MRSLVAEDDFTSRKLLEDKIMNWAIEAELSEKKMKIVEYYIWRNKLFLYNSWKVFKINVSNERFIIRLVRKIHFFIKRLTNNPDLIFTIYFYWFCRDLMNEVMRRQNYIVE